MVQKRESIFGIKKPAKADFLILAKQLMHLTIHLVLSERVSMLQTQPLLFHLRQLSTSQ